MDNLIQQLYDDAKSILFGEFLLKSGVSSPIYIDFRKLISYPRLLKEISEFAWKNVLDNSKFEIICGVPMGALPFAINLSLTQGIPGLLLRPETKDHGSKKRVEGYYEIGQRVLLIEDVATTGSSIIESANVLRNLGLIVEDVLVLLDRCQGAMQNLQQQNIKIHSVFSMIDIITVLSTHGKLKSDMKARILDYLEKQSVPLLNPSDTNLPLTSYRCTLQERLNLINHPVAKKLITIAIEKQSLLCVAADFGNADEVLKLATEIGQEICCLKLHIDAFQNGVKDTFWSQLKKLAIEKQFLIFEDRKLSDSGETVASQLCVFAKNIDLVTLHPIAGAATLKAVVNMCEKDVGCLLVAEMSTENNLTNLFGYRRRSVEIANEFRNIVIGFICQRPPIEANASFLFFTPGVNDDQRSDSCGQLWRSTHAAIVEDRCDIVIVGRGVTNATNKLEKAKLYKQLSWKAYLDAIGQ